MNGDTSWSLGTLLGLPAFAIIIVLLLAGGVWTLLVCVHRADSYDVGLFRMLGIGSLVAAVLVAVIAAWGFYPYHAEYHQWTVTSGTVTEVNSRLIGKDGGGSTQRFVVNIKGVGDRGCDDTRCATVKVGDVLTLTCKREWQFAGTDGYGCNFVKVDHR